MNTQYYLILCTIKFNVSSNRTWPIKDGYRPGFNFGGESFLSGVIKLLDKKELLPGESCDAKIYFPSDLHVANISKGKNFTFTEGPNQIGEGYVNDVLGWVDY
jgi:translation elongation factor EF-Tu-like GTPase